MLVGGSYTIESRDNVPSSLKDVGDGTFGGIVIADLSLPMAVVSVCAHSRINSFVSKR